MLSILRSALEALEDLRTLAMEDHPHWVNKPHEEAVTNFRAAIEQIEEAEPDYELVIDYSGLVLLRGELRHQHGAKLFTFPPDAAAEIERLKKRLEIDDEAAGWDGIACRDETIKLQDEKIERLTKELDRADETIIRACISNKELRQQLAEREGWQPIETAPKDRFLLLCGPSGYTTTPLVFTTGRMCSDYHVGQWIDHANDNLTDWGFEPTHWRPLPAAPKPGDGE